MSYYAILVLTAEPAAPRAFLILFGGRVLAGLRVGETAPLYDSDERPNLLRTLGQFVN